MKLFQNLSLTAKLLVCFGVSMAIAAWMGYSSLMRMGQMNAGTRVIVNEALSGTKHMGDLEGQMKLFRLYEFRHILETSDSELTKYEETMQTIASKVDSLFGEYEKSATQQEDRQNLTDLKGFWKTYLEKHSELLALGRAHNFKACNALMKARFVDFSRVSDQLHKMSEWDDKRANTLANEAGETYSSTRSSTMWLLVVFAVVGVGIALFVTKIGKQVEASQLATAKALQESEESQVEVSKSLAESQAAQTEAAKALAQAEESQSSLSKVLAKVRAASNSIATGSVQVSAGNAELSTRTEEQAASLEETASSMEEMTSTIKQNADNAKLASQLASQARDVAETGGTVVRDAVTAMGEINDGSKKIADIISVIDEIAFQTNLLALNAAVEAARVGEQGRGFAVVAAEVRNLAGRSATAAKEIKALVQDSVGKVQVGSELVNQSGQRLHEIVESVKKVADIVAEISAASMEQASGVEQVNKAVMQMDKMTQQNAALVEEVSAASQSMSVHAKELQAVVATTKIDSQYESEDEQRRAEQERPELASTGTYGKPAPRSSRSATKLKIVNHVDEFEEF